ncbi:MAG: hypothetical protein WCC45_09450 [Paeniglutamicibacter sp.]
MSKSIKKILAVFSGLTLRGLNVAVVTFFVLWQIADSSAIDRMETSADIDPAQMLPDANLMWMAAHASFIMLMIADVLAILFVVMLVKSRKSSDSTLGVPSRESVLKR